MAPGKLFITNDLSSPENCYQRQKEKSTQDNERSYNCNYCKRGFTNAQALGGHMNIHRKDKAKTKQKIDVNEEEPSIHDTEGKEMYSNLRYIPNRVHSFDDHHFHLQQQLNYYMALREQAKYRVYLPPSNPNNTVQSGNLHASSNGYDHVNLGLKSRVDLNEDVKERENEGVDLELRLGHNPKYIGD